MNTFFDELATIRGVKMLLRIGVMALLVFVGIWIIIQVRGGKAPEGLGVHNGGLGDCPDQPNCVCSDCESPQKLAPLQFSGEPAEAKAALKKALAKKKIQVVEENETYLHAVATTPIMRFHDDLEFQIVPDSKTIHFRSASRLGKSDFGKNRERLDEIFAELKKDKISPGENKP